MVVGTHALGCSYLLPMCAIQASAWVTRPVLSGSSTEQTFAPWVAIPATIDAFSSAPRQPQTKIGTKSGDPVRVTTHL